MDKVTHCSCPSNATMCERRCTLTDGNPWHACPQPAGHRSLPPRAVLITELNQYDTHDSHLSVWQVQERCAHALGVSSSRVVRVCTSQHNQRTFDNIADMPCKHQSVATTASDRVRRCAASSFQTGALGTMNG